MPYNQKFKPLRYASLGLDEARRLT